MAKPIPSVLDDLLFHTLPDDHADPARRDDAGDGAPRTTDWTPPDWSREKAGNRTSLAIHPDRWPTLRAYAAAEGVSLRDAVDRALALLLSRPRP